MNDAHETLANVLHDHGRLSYQTAEVEDWRECGRADVHDDVARKAIAALSAAGLQVVPTSLLTNAERIVKRMICDETCCDECPAPSDPDRDALAASIALARNV